MNTLRIKNNTKVCIPFHWRLPSSPTSRCFTQFTNQSRKPQTIWRRLILLLQKAVDGRKLDSHNTMSSACRSKDTRTLRKIYKRFHSDGHTILKTIEIPFNSFCSRFPRVFASSISFSFTASNRKSSATNKLCEWNCNDSSNIFSKPMPN